MPSLISSPFFLASVSNYQCMFSKPTRKLLSFFSSVSSIANIPEPTSLLYQYLIDTFKLTKSRALTISDRFSRDRSLYKPQTVHNFFQELGFSQTQIEYIVRVSPQLLFSDINKTLKPKIDYFQQLGFVGSDLLKFISKNSTLLTFSLDKKLVPCVEFIKLVLQNDQSNKDLIRVLKRCYWVLCADPQARLLRNIVFLESYGIVGSQLSALFKYQPHLFVIQESLLRDFISRVVNMGFPLDSRLLVHALHTISSLSNETLKKKLDLLYSFGFSKDECMTMFRRTPALFRTSEKKLKFGIDFFLNTVKLRQLILVHSPWILMYSIDKRVIPRYKVLQVIERERLLARVPKFYPMLCLTDDVFIRNFIMKFPDNAEELLVAYKGHLLDSIEFEEKEE